MERFLPHNTISHLVMLPAEYLPRVQCQDTTINLSPLFSGSAQASLKLRFVPGLNLADMICEDVIVQDMESYYEI